MVKKNSKLLNEILILFLSFMIIFAIMFFVKQMPENNVVKNTSFDYSAYKEKADNVLKVLLYEYNLKYKPNYKELSLLKEEKSCLLKSLNDENCNIISYNKIYSFKTNNSEGIIGYAIFRNETLLKQFLEETYNSLLLKAKNENYTFVLYDLNIISITGVNSKNMLMLLTDIYKEKQKEYYSFFWDKNILWFVKEKTSEETFIRRSFGDSTDFNNTKKYVDYYNLTLP